MFDYMDYLTQHGHEQLVFNHDKETGLRAIIAIHSTRLGPGLGGTRLWKYPDTDAAVLDVLRLSEGMTYKAAAAGLSLGGAKAVIMADGKESDPALREARFKAFGRFIDSLSGRYITAEDVGTTMQDMVNIRTSTQHVTGLPLSEGGSGDPSPMTAVGVLHGIRAAVAATFKTNDLSGLTVSIQGLGKVGYALAELLLDAGCTVYGTDINDDVLQQARQIGIKTVGLDEIYDVDADIFAPCALGAVLNDETIPRLKCKVIAGSANNQLKDIDRHSDQLSERGITYIVDYVVNAGGLINVAHEITGYDEAAARQRTAGIYDTVCEMLELAKSEHITTDDAAMRIVRSRLDAARPEPAARV